LVIVGNWKSGSTLLQYLLAQDKNIHNIFPNDKYPHNEGALFLEKHLPIPHELWGSYIPSVWLENNKNVIELMANELNSMHNPECKFGLWRRPQLILRLNLVKRLLPNAKIIAIKRDILPNVYSMHKMFTRERQQQPQVDIEYAGPFPPFWKEFSGKDITTSIERYVWQYHYIYNLVEDNDIFTITYENLCNNTENTLRKISKYIEHDIDIPIPKLTCFNDEYKTGSELISKNKQTEKGMLEISNSSVVELPPFTNEEIRLVRRLSRLYSHTDVLRFK